jgi:hypothetical protein
MRKLTTTLLLFVFLFSFSSFAQEFKVERNDNPTSSPRELVELGWDGPNTNSIGAANADFIVATKLTATMLTPYVGKGLVKVKFYIAKAPVGNTATVKIYASGTASAPGPELFSQLVTVTINAWNEFTLPSAIEIPTGDLWIGIKAQSQSVATEVFWAGCDAGPNMPNGQFMYFNNAWTTLAALNPALTYNWNIRGVVDTNVPVELASFSGSCVNGSVVLNWVTASEMNNRGFEIQRKSTGTEFIPVAFVNGQGTTTETIEYTYSDRITAHGIYTYRLKQVDFNGNYEYSNEIELDAFAPVEFALNQNYPNPFNPSTVVSFSLAVDSKVSLRVFNLLGQEISTLFDGDLNAGIHQLNLDLSGANSGIYFYQIQAAGIDGSSFKSAKKMTLTK